MLWFKCAAVHDPVRPVVKKPAVIGWEAKQRQVDLVIERSFEGDEFTIWWWKPGTRPTRRLFHRNCPKPLAGRSG